MLELHEDAGGVLAASCLATPLGDRSSEDGGGDLATSFWGCTGAVMQGLSPL